MKPETEGGGCGVATDDAIGEGWIADREVEPTGQPAARVVFAADAGLGVDETGNARGDRIVFDAGQPRGLPQTVGHQGEEQAGAHAGFENAPAVEAEMPRGTPDGADQRLRREMRILGRSLQRRDFRGCRGGGQALPDLLPALTEVIGTRQREAVLGKLGRAEADEPEQFALLIRRRCATTVLDLLGERDSADVVARPGWPATREGTLAGEGVVGAAHGRDGRRVWCLRRRVPCRGDQDLRGLGHFDGPADGGAVEETESVLCGVGHEGLRACACNRPLDGRCAGLCDEGTSGRRGAAPERWVVSGT
jgi:hypothetical protein